MEMLTGYHFTTSSALKKIRKNGLIPYAMPKMARELGLVGKTKGIWLWQRLPKDDNLVGITMLRIICHHETSIVLLQAKFPASRELARIIKQRWKATWTWGHDGAFTDNDNPSNSWVFHKQEPSFIVVNRIPPQNIKRLATFNLRAMLMEKL